VTMTLELECCERTLLGEIADPRMHQRDVAMTYRLAMLSSERASIDWAKVNQAILKRWPKGLTRIKEMAWRMTNP